MATRRLEYTARFDALCIIPRSSVDYPFSIEDGYEQDDGDEEGPIFLGPLTLQYAGLGD